MKHSIQIVAFLLTLFPLAAETTPLADPDMEKMRTHLVFLGYECTPRDDHGKVAIKCKTNENQPNLHIQRKSTGFLITYYRIASEYGKKNESEMVRLANQMNTESISARFYIDSEKDLIMECFSPGAYTKAGFGNLLETFNEDWGRVRKKFETEMDKLLD